MLKKSTQRFMWNAVCFLCGILFDVQCPAQRSRCHRILTPGCVMRYPLDTEMLSFVKKAKDDVEAALRAQGKL